MSLEQPAGLSIQSELKQGDEASGIYTHSPKIRVTVFYIIVLYTVMMVFFMQTVKGRLDSIQDLPEAFRQSSTSWFPESALPIVAIAAFVLALGLFLYLLWAAFDIWGLEVEVNAKDIMVRNTILGNFLARFTGVGKLSMQEIGEIRGGKFATRVIGDNRMVRFSPVQKVDKLIAFLIAHAPNARIN